MMVVDWPKLVAQKKNHSMRIDIIKVVFWRLLIYKYCQYLHKGMLSIKIIEKVAIL